MKTLTIRDLPATETLDRKAMSAVRGGMYKFAPYWGPHFSAHSVKKSIDVSQLIGQTQNVSNANGNNVAFAHGIRSTVNPTQSAHNNVSF